MTDVGRGAYGFRLVFPDEQEQPRDLVTIDGGAPEITVRRRGAPVEDRYELTDGRVAIATRERAGFAAIRDPASIELESSETVSIDAAVHPMLTVPMSIFARWRGDITLHAGAFETEAGAWIVAGQREAGKSTMLASLAAHGVPIVADDLIVMQDGQAWAGPDCVDLRPDVVDRFPGARSIGTVGGRERWRIATPSGRLRLPVRGMFLLEWADGTGIEVAPLSALEVLRLIFEQEYISLLGFTDRMAALELGALPAWALRRPRDWGAAQDVVGALLETTRSVGASGA